MLRTKVPSDELDESKRLKRTDSIWAFGTVVFSVVCGIET